MRQHNPVTPCVGVWIETYNNSQEEMFNGVTPCVGVWIETLPAKENVLIPWSHPAWVCGLKPILLQIESIWSVTPCVGVWIETVPERKQYAYIKVTPCVGVWIETYNARIVENTPWSHPAWVCGLKHPDM